MYKKAFAQRLKGNKYMIHLWDDLGYHKIPWTYYAYEENEEGKYVGLNGEKLEKISNWWKDNPYLHFHDMPAHQRFLIDKYGTDDEPSTTHKEVFFDIEIQMGDALTPEYIKKAPKKVTSIAWYYKQEDRWEILILDEDKEIEDVQEGNIKITPVENEPKLLALFLEKFRDIDPDILIGWNSDYFDIPYIYWRICNVLGEDFAKYLSPIGVVNETPWFNAQGQYLDIAGVESLDYMRLHKKYSWADEPSYKLDDIGIKYVNLGKIEYEGSLDRLFKTDIKKFVQYNFRDVEILKELDKKLEYLILTKNLSHKGKHNYSEVYANTKTQDGAISAYLLSQNIIPPAKERNPINKKGYAGGYLFCPKAGIYNYVYDEDLTSLYPSILMTLNIGKETLICRIITENDRDNRLGLTDLKQKDPSLIITIEDADRNKKEITIGDLIYLIESSDSLVSANGVVFSSDKKSVLSIILAKWFDERVLYKDQMKAAYKSGDNELGAKFHMKQYTMKILLNSLYGALALGSFRYGNYILAEACTLSGWRIIQESALCVNNHMNRIMKKLDKR